MEEIRDSCAVASTTQTVATAKNAFLFTTTDRGHEPQLTTLTNVCVSPSLFFFRLRLVVLLDWFSLITRVWHRERCVFVNRPSIESIGVDEEGNEENFSLPYSSGYVRVCVLVGMMTWSVIDAPNKFSSSSSSFSFRKDDDTNKLEDNRRFLKMRVIRRR